ncbi:MAG: glucose-1-phosphate cytidylyltransferase [Candidatus Dormibacteraeota bacterium]|nr:glucose-1-phosphate cytidylyltransferase [Candidatus Dormibacteraeota bacterium]
MKVVILAGGLGTRLSEETEIRPKPMVEIGGRPILWHIMKHYAHYGFNEFVLALGYKGEDVKRYFLDYYRLNGNVSIDLGTGQVEVSHEQPNEWNVHLVDTGLQTNTGGRVRRLRSFLGDEPFMLTYGDGVCDLNLRELLTFHKANRGVATITAVRPPARFGGLLFSGDRVSAFTEKPQVGEGWINGGFMVFEPKIFDYLTEDQTSLEADALEQLAADGELVAYRHDRFWQCMDTLRDVRLLERLWQSGKAPWSTWD